MAEKKEESLLDKGLDFTDKLGKGILDTFVPGGDNTSKNLRLIKMALILNENRNPGVAPATQYLKALDAGQTFGPDLDQQLKALKLQKLKNELDPQGNVPIPERIAKVNALYDAGHTIKYMTARGITSGVDYEPLTRRQLMAWGAKYHELSVGKKEHYDIWIDDKAVNSESYFIDCKGETYE